MKDIRKSFSILCRIVWIVTARIAYESINNALFQYPVSDRLDCNLGIVSKETPLLPFQYPVSDRLDCNPETSRSSCSRPPTFSILCRIVWIVTLVWACVRCNSSNFQYPVSDRLDCNLGR